MHLVRDSRFKARTWKFLLVGCLATAGLMFLQSEKRHNAPDSIRKKRPVDLSTLTLDEAKVKALSEQHGLAPVKARGATIFVDVDGYVRIPPDDIVALMEFRDLEETYHRYLESIQVPCKRQIHLGRHEDGGYDLCEDPGIIPQHPCTVYSFGVRDDFSFDEQLSKTYGCQIHSFDPANGMSDHQHSSTVFFHSMGLGDTDTTTKDNWKMRTANTIMAELGHAKKDIAIMKIDIEGGEWKALPEMLKTGALNHVRQLIMEFHSFVDLPPWQLDHRNKGDYRQHLKVLRGLYCVGFRIFFFKRFPGACCLYYDEFGVHRTGCHEIHLMKVK